MAMLDISCENMPGGGLHVHLAGSVESKTLHSFEHLVERLLKEEKHKLILLDLSALSYISSRGVALILDLWDWTRKNSGRMILVNPIKAVREIFETLGLAKILTIMDDMPSAQKALKA